MPELPEVETIKLGLQKYLVGHQIEAVDVKFAKIFQGEPKNVIGAKVKEVKRFGKGLVIDLSNDYSIAVHVKLTGQLIYRDDTTKNIPVSQDKVGSVPNKFTHVVFTLDKGATLYYNDQRRFGWIKIVPTNKVSEMSYFKGMGPEPFKDLTYPKFKAIVSVSSVKIKPLLMDQKRIGGIGNIYANDALFLSGIDPRRKANTVTETELVKLYAAIHKVMERSLKYGGASELSFVNVLGQEGEYQRHSLVYGKRGQSCPNNNGKIEKIYLAGRGTFFCSACQK